MKIFSSTLLFLALSFFTVPSWATIPLVLNSGDVATCGPGGQVANVADTVEIANTIYDSFYRSECFYADTTTHVILDSDILAGETYTIYLHFSEIFFRNGFPEPGDGDGSRVFHVDVEGIRIISDLDLHALDGPNNVRVYKYDVDALNNGSISITLVPLNQNAKISAIEIRPIGDASSLPPTIPIIDVNSASFPVEWLGIEGTLVGNNQVALSWETAWESNNDGFEIQMGTAGNALQTVEFVKGAGNSTSPLSYTFQTGILTPGRYLFRLKQRDFDGQFSLSPMVELEVGNITSIVMDPIYPNPASEHTILRFWANPGDEVQMRIVSLQGQVLKEAVRYEVTDGGPQRLPLRVKGLASGIYFVYLQVEDMVAGQRLVVTE